MKKNIITVPAQIEKVETRADRSVKVVVGTATELDPMDTMLLFDLGRKTGHFAFSETAVSEDTFADLPDELPEFESVKTPAQRLRGALYRLWESQGEHGDFELYYLTSMERLITSVKEKIDA